MDKHKSQKDISEYRRQMALREGLNFSDYFSDDVPYEVKPVPSTIPMQEEESNYVGHSDISTQSKDLFKGLWEDTLYNNREYWLSPQAKFMNATNKGHEWWAIEYLDANHVEYDLETHMNEPYNTMYGLGFIRVKVSGNEIYYNYSAKKEPTNAQLRALRNSAIESNMELSYQVFDEDTNKLTPNRKVDLNESLLLEDILDNDSEYWLDPNGNFHAATSGHQQWGEEYLDKHRIPFYARDAYKREPEPDDNLVGLYQTLYKHKFMRIYVDYNIIYAGNNSVMIPSNAQMRALKDTAIESKKALQVNKQSVDLMEKYVNKDGRALFIESMMPDNIDTFKSHLVQLFAYLQKELQLKTVPSVKLISDDKNADKVLGKTAYYNPDEKLVVLYIVGRHQKDILRSFAHEIIHHWQHENEKLHEGEGKAGTGDPQYAQNNPWLRQMEKQAYLLGNILFRDWEDQKKAQDKKSGNDGKAPVKKNKQVTEKTYSLGNQYPSKKMDYRG